MIIHLILNTFTNIEHADGRDEPLREDSPCIVIATSGMLEGGPVLEYFRNFAPNPKNKILFVSYQVNGTLGRRVMDGARQVTIMEEMEKLKWFQLTVVQKNLKDLVDIVIIIN